MKDNSGMTPEQWEHMHKEMGCPRCFFVDDVAVGKGPCCTYPQQLKVEDGICQTRREPSAAKATGEGA